MGERSRADFWKFFAGQGLSQLGSAFTLFAVPVLVYQLTGSATDLAIAGATTGLPYLLFGLAAGAWADRVDRKRLMIATDLLRAAVLASVPALYALGALPLWWVYASGFLVTTLSLLFNAAEFAAIPSLVSTDDLVEANGRIQASYSFASVAGPPLAGLLALLTPVANVLLLDALTFAVSAVTLAWIGRSFNAGERPGGGERRSVSADIAEGLRYVWQHPVLRSISIMMALVNFVAAPVWVELVLFATERFSVGSFRYGLLVSAGSVGMLLLSLAAGPLRRRFSFSQVALGALMASGLLTVAFALAPSYWVALPLFAVAMGLGPLFNINTASLRQAIVPNELLGRIMSVAMVLAASATPLGALLGGYLVERIGVTATYALVGALCFAIPVAFAFSPLGRADDHTARDPAGEPGEPVQPGDRAAPPAEAVAADASPGEVRV